MGNSIFASVVANFKKTLIPVRDEKLAIYLPTGDIAKAVKPAKGCPVEKYRVFIGDKLYEVPAQFVTTKIPVLRISKPVDQLTVGDIIRTENGDKFTYRRVTAVKDGKVTTSSYAGAAGNKIVAVADILTGQATVSVAINLLKGFNWTGAQGGLAGQATANNSLAMLAMLGDDGDDLFAGEGLDKLIMLSAFGGQGMNIQSILPFLMLKGDKKGGDFGMKDMLMLQMCQGGATAGSFNPMMLMMLGDKDGGSFEDLLVMQAMTGMQNAANPFANLFQGLIPAGAAAPAATEVPAGAVAVETTGDDAE